MKFKSNARGFTLIELLVVIVVVGMLSSIGVSTYNNYTVNTKISVIKKTINDLHRFTVLHARATDSFYSELSLGEIVDKFNVKKPSFTQIAYIASDTDFLYEATLPSGGTFSASLVSNVYAIEKNSYYAIGTDKAMKYFYSLDIDEKENLIKGASDPIIAMSLKKKAEKEEFNYKVLTSPWDYDLPDEDKDGIPDYRDECPKISGIYEIKGCPLVDTDGDGVTDDKDQCPNEAGDKYAWGCVIEQENITITMTSAGPKKINAIKVVRAITGLGLKEAKYFVENLPRVIKSNLNASEAQEIKRKIEEVGGSVDYNGTGESSNSAAVNSSHITIKLTSYGAKKIGVIKAVRQITGLGLKEAKKIIDTIPSVIKSNLTTSEAQEIKRRIEEAGGSVDYNGTGESSNSAAANSSRITIIMTSAGPKKINAIKAIRKVLGLGLKEAKNFVESLPKVIKSDISQVEAEKIKGIIEGAGGSVDYKGSVTTSNSGSSNYKGNFSVRVLTMGSKKIAMIKVVRAITGLGLKEAKYFVENLPRIMKENISQDDAVEINNRIKEAGGTAEIYQ